MSIIVIFCETFKMWLNSCYQLQANGEWPFNMADVTLINIFKLKCFFVFSFFCQGRCNHISFKILKLSFHNTNTIIQVSLPVLSLLLLLLLLLLIVLLLITISVVLLCHYHAGSLVVGSFRKLLNTWHKSMQETPTTSFLNAKILCQRQSISAKK